jgi:hypothetical protein
MTVSNGLCVVLGTVLGAGIMWVGMNTKTPQRPLHIQNQVVPLVRRIVKFSGKEV